jgi:putative SOS response-associated peptidase YedK
MCNLYSITTNQETIRGLFRKVNRYVGNLAPMPGVFPNYPAPVIRNAANSDEAELVMMRWATFERDGTLQSFGTAKR